MIVRLLLGAGLFALGYYVGREVGRTAPVREELARRRAAADEPPFVDVVSEVEPPGSETLQ